jgi:hypothetical protein
MTRHHLFRAATLFTAAVGLLMVVVTAHCEQEIVFVDDVAKPSLPSLAKFWSWCVWGSCSNRFPWNDLTFFPEKRDPDAEREGRECGREFLEFAAGGSFCTPGSPEIVRLICRI